MLYPYAEFPGKLSIAYSQVIKDRNGEKVLVQFKKPTDCGFKKARYSLPDFKEIYNYDFTLSETRYNVAVLKRNAPLIIQCAKDEETTF